MTDPKTAALKSSDWLSTSSTLLNLAISDHPARGIFKGGYFLFVGDSSSGKTWWSFACLAEAAHNKSFKDYRLIRDDVEHGALMDVGHYFGKATERRLETPEPSTTVDELYYRLDDLVREDTPFIYVVDSMDGLSSESSDAKFEETKKASRKGMETAGSYGDGKAKKNSRSLRRLMPRLHETGSILIIISQTRDNLGFGFTPKTRSGGRALRFYANLEIWLSVKKNLTRTVMGEKVQVGVDSLLEVKKNRVNGNLTKVTTPIYHSVGIDNVGSCVDYLISKKAIETSGKKLSVPEWEFTGGREALIATVQERGLETELDLMVATHWKKIRDASKVSRRIKYS